MKPVAKRNFHMADPSTEYPDFLAEHLPGLLKEYLLSRTIENFIGVNGASRQMTIDRFARFGIKEENCMNPKSTPIIQGLNELPARIYIARELQGAQRQ